MTALIGRRHLHSDAPGSAYFPTKPGQNSRQSYEGQPRSDAVPLNFPATKDILWDRTPTGEPTVLHIIKYRNISLHILEKSVQLAYRHALQEKSLPYRCFLIGSVISDKDEEGVTIAVDRFDPGQDVPGRSGRMPTARLPGDHVIPLTLSSSHDKAATTHSTEDFKATFKFLEHSCSSRDTPDIGNFLSLRIQCCCYDSADDMTFNLHIGAITMGNVLEATPINPLPIIPTALARNLTGPLNLSEIQGCPKAGYITMDQTRKLLLLLESDPKACTLPLIGIWVSGLSNICSPNVWASSLRYIFNSSISERVCTGDQGFLLVMFSPTNRQPAFYECRSLSGDRPVFELVGCRENIHFYKHTDHTSRTPVQLELTTARDGPNRAAFIEAAQQFTPACSSQAIQTKPHPKPTPIPSTYMVTASEEDAHMMPRPSPKPLIDKSPTVKPSVPELSVIFDSFIADQQELGQPPHPQELVDPPAPLGEVIPQEELPEGYRNPRHQVAGDVQAAQENYPFGIGSNGQEGLIGRGMKVGHSGAPAGRSGPLKPVNTNLARDGEKSLLSNPHNPQGKIEPSRPGMKPTVTPSLAQNGRIQQPRAKPHGPAPPKVRQTNQVLHGDSTPRRKPPRPTSRKSEVLQRTLPSKVGGHQTVPPQKQGCPPPRRMSYPVPASSSQMNHHSNGPVPRPHPVQSRQASQSTESQARRGPHLRHPSSHQTSGVPPQDPSSGTVDHRSPNPSDNLPNNRPLLTDSKVSPTLITTSGHTASHLISATPKISSGLSGSSPINHSYPITTLTCTASTLNNVPYEGHNAQRSSSMPNPHPVPPPHGPRHTAVGTPPILTGTPQASHAVPYPNQAESSPTSVVGSHPSNMVVSSPSAIPNNTLPGHQGPPLISTGHASEGANRKDIPPDALPPSGPTQEVHQQPLVGQDMQGARGDWDTGGGNVDNDTLAQLKRQEQLIQQLQAQIQLLLQARATQSVPPIPSGLMTPPATPTSPAANNLPLATPTPKLPHSPHPNQVTPTSSVITGQGVVTPVVQPLVTATVSTAHSISTDTGHAPPLPKTTCSTAVMTGKSLLWPDPTGPPVKGSISVATSITPQSSPNKGSMKPTHSATNCPVTPDFELTPESDSEMTLPLQQTRDETQSTMFDVSAVDLQSFTEEGSPRQTSSPTISPKWLPSREGDTLQPIHPQTTQGAFPMDNLQSPVLGESASICSPQGRGWQPPDGTDIEDGSSSDDDDGGSPEVGDATDEEEASESDGEHKTRSADQPVSLLYRDERKFYQNLLGKVERMLTEQTKGGVDGSHGNTLTTPEKQRQMGLPASEGHSEMTADCSVTYRSMCMVNSEFFPRINYVSLMDMHLDSPNLSYEANAIAMKYLTEEELTQLSAGFKGQATSLAKVNPLLRTALTGLGDMDGANGVSAVDLSMASRKYMEKYNLLDTPAKKPGHARTLGFDTIDETPAQKFFTKKTLQEGQVVSGKKRRVKKPRKVLNTDAPVVTEGGPYQGQTLTKASEPLQEGGVRISSEQRTTHDGTDAKSTEKSSGKVPPPKPPRQSPASHAPSRPWGQTKPETGKAEGQNNPANARHEPGDIRPQTSDRTTQEKSGSTILDIERLKQLPKLF
ncbi:SCL-interrupting locus protein homolog [Acanthaster planci]|uniref:SCL-interrupting locus protein homolog n=1 Tax=Acanthaster planci TaxID=133434 RepID=A0A8B7Y7X3_ACAPL|nr:SCL-interrupting locus protein homolog [Acanthaster planci]